MRREIKRIAPLQAAKVSALLYFLMSIPFVLLFSVAAALSPASKAAFSIGFLICMPILYLVMGFIVTLIGAWGYNVVAGWIGGIEITLGDEV